MSKFRRYIGSIQADAENQYSDLFNRHLYELTLEAKAKNNGLKMLDVGCSDGSSTLRLIGNVKNIEIHGLEVVEERVEKAKENGILARVGKADESFPYEDDEFDVITSNQVIEHLNNQDMFLAEIYRVLKPGGIFLVCTANLSSWHNIGALFMGWQPFPMTNFSEKDAAIGNPFAFHCGEQIEHISMLHTRLYTLRALKDFLRLHKFEVVEADGTGYYPLPTNIAKIMSKLDPSHSAFQYIKARKSL